MNANHKVLSAASVFLMLFWSAFAHGTIVHESAIMGTPDLAGALSGPTLAENQFLASRFTLSTTTVITSFGGHISTSNGSVWGAIVAMPSGTSALPDFFPTDIESNVLVSALFEDPGPSADLRATVNLTLGPGSYAVIFGGGSYFSATGTGLFDAGMPDPTDQLDLPGASYFFANASTDDWFNGGLVRNRFVVESNVVPIPPAVWLFGSALGLMGVARRKISS